MFYDGTKLLSMMDLNGTKPEIYICTSNRSAGKTTYFGRYVVNRFLKHDEKFCLIYRYNYELDDCADKFFKDISQLFFNGKVMTSKRRAKGIYHELYLGEKMCGYAISLNSSDQLKKYSHLFSGVKRMFFDEFQSESNHYCSNEIKKFISIHTSIARGNGEQCRYLPVIMCANNVSIINPYYVKLGVSDRLKNDTVFLKGNGFVLENGFVESASILQKNSGFNKAFSSDKYVSYSTENSYLNDNIAFVEKVSGRCRYLATIKYESCEYSIKEYSELGIIYCDDKIDKQFKNKITLTTNDHTTNYIMLKNNDLFISSLRYYFEMGCFRFKNLQCKNAILHMLSY